MNDELSQNDIELLEYYHKKKRQKKIIIYSVIGIIVLALLGYTVYSTYSQTYWEVREENIVVEYGETYEPVLGALVDTNKYSFITLDNTTITDNLKQEQDKEYLAIGDYKVTLSHKGNIKLLSFNIPFDSKKEISVQAKDTTPPTIKSPEIIEMVLGQSLDMEQYYYLFEVSDLSETKELQLDASDVDNNTVGEYIVKASVEDVYGNKQTSDVPCSVITDPYGEEGTMEVETTTEPPTTSETTTQQPEEVAKKEETTQKPATTESKNKPVTTKKKSSYVSKDFLFEDGYTMSNVSEVATEYLRSSGKAGECVPLKDKDGIYIGMRVIIYE